MLSQINFASFDLAVIHTQTKPCWSKTRTSPYGSKWSKILYLTLRFLQRVAALHSKGIHIKCLQLNLIAPLLPSFSQRWSSPLCYVCVGMSTWLWEGVGGKRGESGEGERRTEERKTEEYWPCGVVDIASLNKRLMPRADKVWAENERKGNRRGEQLRSENFFCY